MGALIGDALGVGPHWYYDIEELRRDHGEWISGYTTPKPGHYHEGLKAGQSSQSGILTILLMRSLLAKDGYVEADFCGRLEKELFPQLNGTAKYGPGGFTSQSIREAWQKKVVQGKSWKETGGLADTTEAAERALVLAAWYAKSPAKVVESVSSNCRLTQIDETVVAMTTAYSCVLALLVTGEKMDSKISDRLLALMRSGKLPFLARDLKDPSAQMPKASGARKFEGFSSPDALLTPSYVAEAALDPGIQIEPPWKVSYVYGMPCAIYHQLPAAYYLAARFSGDFEQAVLQAINGGGQNQSRAILTGALVGAQVGLSGIPQRFLDGLENCGELVELAKKLGERAAS